MTLGVQIFQSGDQGQTTIANTAGSHIANIFDPCLVNGYNSLSVSSMTRSGSTVTVTTGSTHGYPVSSLDYPYVYIKIAGATETDYNGVWKATPTGASTLTFDIGAATPTTPATGTITCARAPAGWTKAFTGTNKAAYLSPDGKMYLRVDNTGTTSCLLRSFRTMSDVDTGTDPFPTVAQVTNGIVISTSSSGRAWMLAVKQNYMNLWAQRSTTADFGDAEMQHIGKLANQRVSGDDYAYIMHGSKSASGDTIAANWKSWNDATVCGYMMRNYAAASGAVGAHVLGGAGVPTNTLTGSNSAAMATFPQPGSSDFLYENCLIGEQSARQVRGTLPGLRFVHGNLVGNSSTYDTFQGSGADVTRRFMVLKLNTAASCLLEISDTWDS